MVENKNASKTKRKKSTIKKVKSKVVISKSKRKRSVARASIKEVRVYSE